MSGSDMKRHWASWAGRGYVYSLLLVAAIVMTGHYVRGNITLSNHIIVYLLAVVYSAVQWGRGPAILTAVTSTVVFDIFFVPPYFAFAPPEPKYVLTLISLLVVGLVIGTLTGRLREQTDAARQREADMASLYACGRDLSEVTQLAEVLETCVRHIGRAVAADVAVFLPEQDVLRRAFAGPGWIPDERAEGQALLAFERGQASGWERDGESGSLIGCVPMKTAAGIVGVLVIRRALPPETLSAAQERLLKTLSGQAGLAIERARLEEKERQAQLLREKYKLQKALLDSISHDLRTPLASITGAISTLHDDGRALDESTRADLIGTARHEAERLNRLVGNLLDMTRLEAGALRVAPQPCDMEDVIGTALAQIGEVSASWPVSIQLARGLPLVPLDFVLVTQVMVNLLDNAMKYSPQGSPIEIQVATRGGQLEVRVADQGIGIPEDALERVFEKFYRVSRSDGVKGSGLGLSICKGLIEAHGGRIRAEQREGGGTRIVFTLPLEPVSVSVAKGADE